MTASRADGEVSGIAEKLGKVSFANSCDGAVQATLERSVALLHSFWWDEGRKAFQQVIDQDPTCAIATWGIASIDLGNPFAAGPSPAQAKDAQEAIARGRSVAAKTDRENAYIAAIASYYDGYPAKSHGVRLKALSDAFEALAARFPDDDEAQLFEAIYLVGTQPPTDKTFARTLKGAGILEAQYLKHPEHPGVSHYLIHAYDYPPIAKEGLPAARRYAGLAPSAPHALHMPSHIFTRVGAWQESIATNQRAVAVAKSENVVDEQLHSMDYMVYAELQLARDADAHDVIASIAQTGKPSASRTGPFAIAEMFARYPLERGDWREAAQVPLSDSAIPYVRAMPVYARALGAARSGNVAAAESDTQELERIADALKKAKDTYWGTEVEVQYLSAAAWTEYAKGNLDNALKVMRGAADLEDSSEKSAATPGRLVPARELLGDMLRDNGNPAAAMKEYEASLSRDPRRFRSLFGAGQAAAAAGNSDSARAYYSQLVDMTGPDGIRPELTAARAFLASK